MIEINEKRPNVFWVEYTYIETKLGEEQFMAIGLFFAAIFYSLAFLLVKPAMKRAIISFVIYSFIALNVVGYVGICLGIISFRMF